MTVGPWKPIALHTYHNRIADLDIRTDVSEALDVKLTADISFSEKAPGTVSFVLKKPDGTVEVQGDSTAESGQAQLKFEWAAGKLDLWYPVGYGKQPLYTVLTTLKDKVRIESQNSNLNGSDLQLKDGNVLDEKSLKIAFRRARVVQDKLIDQEGLTFLFEINNVRIFCGGMFLQRVPYS